MPFAEPRLLTDSFVRSRGHRVTALAFMVLTIASGRAAAQDCGSWPRPVLCEAELVALRSSGDSVRLRGRARIQIPPREEVELQLEGRDQNGRRFPDGRVTLGYDEGTCQTLVNVSDRGRARLRLTARATAGRCRLELWVPGNLNFAWDLEIEVDPAARAGYSLPEAEFVVRGVYRALLGRDPDAESVRRAVGEVQRGNLENLVAVMARSAEFGQRRSPLDPAQVLDSFYQGLFERPADSGGVREYLRLVEAGRYADVLLRLIRSPEFERRLPGSP